MSHAIDDGPDILRDTIARVAPGTALRDGLERILRGRTGGLIVLGYDQSVEDLCDGGFDLDVAFAPTRLRELSKMDGAVVISTDGSRIVRANVQLIPDPSIPTEESGTRHRAAARTAIHTGYPVISVSQSMSIVSVYAGDVRQVIEDPDALLGRANVALSTLERYRIRRDEVYTALASAEIEDYATLRDAMSVAQRLEMVRRVAEEIDDYVIELGTSGRQLRLQLVELAGDNEHLRELLIRDYLADPDVPSNDKIAAAMAALASVSDSDLLNLPTIADVFGYPPTELAQDTPIQARGYRILSQVPRLQFGHIDLLVRHYRTLQTLLAESAAGLEAVDGIGVTWAGHIRECLSQLAEASIERRR